MGFTDDLGGWMVVMGEERKRLGGDLEKRAGLTSSFFFFL